MVTREIYNPETDTDRLYIHVNRKGGGRGLLQIEEPYKAEIIRTAE
jgi:hypothetical protein